MAKPFLIFPDPIIETLRVLRGPFLADPEVAATRAKVSRTMPKRTADTVDPDVLVADDGDAFTGAWPVSEDVIVRVTVWDADGARAGRLARRARAYLLAYSGDSRVRAYRAATHPLTTTDPDDGTPLSSFTITARLKAE